MPYSTTVSEQYHKGFLIRIGVVQAPEDYPISWAEVWKDNEALVLWYGLRSLDKAKSWIEQQCQNSSHYNKAATA
jgi:hypothetical protein